MKNRKYLTLLVIVVSISIILNVLLLYLIISKKTSPRNSPVSQQIPSTIDDTHTSRPESSTETSDNSSLSSDQSNQKDIITNSIGMKLTYIPNGRCVIGDNDRGFPENERPAFQVERPFFMGIYEVTQKQYYDVMGNNPSYYRSSVDLPVERITYENAVEFCRKLSQMEGITYRLPNEFEWEYACRAGTSTRYYFGDNESLLGEYAWIENNSDYKTHIVGQKKPNKYGLYDMLGNVEEWCQNPYLMDPKEQHLRGGYWGNFCDVNFRDGYLPGFQPGQNHGFRVMTDDLKVLTKFLTGQTKF